MTINGAHFIAGGVTPTVRFNGVLGTVNTSAEYVIKAYPPTGVTTGPISVTSGAAGSYTSAQLFYVPPVITSFSPSSGRTGTNVIIRGANFTGATAVKFGNVAATAFWVTNNNVIGAVVPVGAITGQVRVETPAVNPAITSSNFVIQPTIFGFSPGFGTIGSSVTVTGANFNAANLSVKFAGVVAASPSAISFSNFTVTVPNKATNGPITVTTGDGSFTTAQLFYLPARITSFTPTNGPAGTTVQIKGTNFLGTSAVSFTGSPAASFTVTNNGIIGAVVPPGVINGPIFVTTPFGTTNSGNLVFYGVPIIDGFTPTHGLPGTNVTLLGTNFAGATVVKFNGTNAVFSVQTNGVLTAIVPTNATTGPVSVTVPAGTTVSASSFVLDYSTDLAVSIAAPASLLLGNDFTYIITITNKGSVSAPAVAFTNWLPGEVSFKSASKSQGTLVTSGNPIIGNLGTIGAFAKATVTLTVTPNQTAFITDSAAAFSTLADPIPTNNIATAITEIYVVPLLNLQGPLSNGIRLSWSVNLSDYVLQSSTNLAASNSWSTVATEPEYVGDQKLVTEPIGDGSRFYRLKR
ncbi:MAG: IPT/TIG domain-containing protein [Verrucomicrobiota bacterium]